MARGLPDDANVVKEGPTWSLTDHAELAARLGSIVTFDRLGTVINLETFGDGLARWQMATPGVLATAHLTNERSLYDGVSLRLFSGTGGNPVAQGIWYAAYPQICRMGFEASYAISGTKHMLYHGLNVFKGAYYAAFRIRWTFPTGVIEIWDDGPGWHDTGLTIKEPTYDYMFNTIKMVVNTDTEEYQRFLINDVGGSLKGNYAERVGAPDNPHLQCYGYSRGDGDEAQNVYMDGCILTETEPGTP